MVASGSADDEEPTLEEAQDMLFELLVDLKLRSKLTATDSCVLAYWAVTAGAGGSALLKLAKKPGDSSGKYSRHFDRYTGSNLNDPNFAFVDMPVFLGPKDVAQ